jgi:hypothetical protein
LLQVTNPQSVQAPTMLMMNLKGRIVPNGGGRETQLDCNLLYNVSRLRQQQRQSHRHLTHTHAGVYSHSLLMMYLLVRSHLATQSKCVWMASDLWLHHLLHVVRPQVTAGSALGVVSLGQDSLMSTTFSGPAFAAGGFTGSNGMAMQQQQGSGEMLPGAFNGMGMQQQQQPGAMGMGMNGGMMNGMGMGGAAMPGQQVIGAEQGQVSAQATSGAAAAAAMGVSVLAGLAFVLSLMV